MLGFNPKPPLPLVGQQLLTYKSTNTHRTMGLY